MRTYRVTYSNEKYSYSMISEVADEYCYMYVPGEYIGELSLKKVMTFTAGLDESEECPPVFRANLPNRVLIEDITLVNYVSPLIEDAIL